MKQLAPKLTRRVRAIATVAALVCCAGFGHVQSAGAASVSDLVAERAEQEFGAAMPQRGYFDIRMQDLAIDQGEYIREFWIDQQTGKFIANVVTETADVYRVWGAAVLTVPVPVPMERKMPDEIVNEADIRIVEMPWGRLGAFAIDDPEELVGMQVRRMLVPGRPVPRHSVIPPIIISRGDKVKIKLKHGALQLVAKGRAVTDAHLGQDVRVVNLSSNKTITAIARQEGIVEVLQ